MLEKIEDFLNHLSLEKGSPPNTLIAYRNDLTQLAKFLDRRDKSKVKSWDEVDKDMIIAYILHLKEREYAASTVARKVAATKSFFHFLVTEELIGDDPTATLDSPKVKKQLPKAISTEDVGRLLAEPARLLFFYSQDCEHCQAVINEVLSPLQRKYGAQLEVQSIEISDADNCKWLLDMEAAYQIPPDKVGIPEVFVGDTALIGEAEIRARLDETIAKYLTPKALRDKAMLELMYATGMRATELVELDINDVNLPSTCVRVIGKGDKERIIPIHSRAVKAIETYLRKGRLALLKDTDEKALFLNPRGKRLTRQGLWLIIKYYVERAGLDPDITPHTLRHSFATHMLESGEATLVDVQQFLGHANISTTQIYTRVTSKHKRQVYDKAHPRAK